MEHPKMSSKNLMSNETSEMISLIDAVISIDHAILHVHHRHLVDGPIPSTDERAVMVARFDELWRTDGVDYNTAESGWTLGGSPLTMLAYAVIKAHSVTKMGDRRRNIESLGDYYIPPCRRACMDSMIWTMLLGRDDLDMSTLAFTQTVSLITSLSDEHAMTVMMRPTFDGLQPYPGDAQTLIGWLIEFNRCELVTMMVKSMPDSIVINRLHEYKLYNEDEEFMHVAMVAAEMTSAVVYHNDDHLMYTAEKSLVAVLAHPNTDISQSMIIPSFVNVFGMRALLQHCTIDIHKIQPDDGWEEQNSLYEKNDEESDGDGKCSGDTTKPAE